MGWNVYMSHSDVTGKHIPTPLKARRKKQKKLKFSNKGVFIFSFLFLPCFIFFYEIISQVQPKDETEKRLREKQSLLYAQVPERQSHQATRGVPGGSSKVVGSREREELWASGFIRSQGGPRWRVWMSPHQSQRRVGRRTCGKGPPYHTGAPDHRAGVLTVCFRDVKAAGKYDFFSFGHVTRHAGS